jgi:H+-translocating NAD(P) transhydrogenase subunit alpha
VNESLLSALTIFVLAVLVGFEVISKVPATLHTPLMSGANSIHGIVLVGAMAIAATADNPVSQILALVAVIFAAMNVVGGYVVTDRMLQMFRRRPASAGAAEPARGRPSGRTEEPAPAPAPAGTAGQPDVAPGTSQTGASETASPAPRQTG